MYVLRCIPYHTPPTHTCHMKTNKQIRFGFLFPWWHAIDSINKMRRWNDEPHERRIIHLHDLMILITTQLMNIIWKLGIIWCLSDEKQRVHNTLLLLDERSVMEACNFETHFLKSLACVATNIHVLSYWFPISITILKEKSHQS